jgi:hypothetical protein
MSDAEWALTLHYFRRPELWLRSLAAPQNTQDSTGGYLAERAK